MSRPVSLSVMRLHLVECQLGDRLLQSLGLIRGNLRLRVRRVTLIDHRSDTLLRVLAGIFVVVVGGPSRC